MPGFPTLGVYVVYDENATCNKLNRAISHHLLGDKKRVEDGNLSFGNLPESEKQAVSVVDVCDMPFSASGLSTLVIKRAFAPCIYISSRAGVFRVTVNENDKILGQLTMDGITGREMDVPMYSGTIQMVRAAA
eukprot:51831-Chlamydomonas_euryale.AAC.1